MFFVLLMLPQAMLAQRIALLGDSNTWLGGDNCTSSKGWTYWFAQSLKSQSVYSFARSGATWTNTTNTHNNTQENIAVLGDNNVIYNQVLRLIEKKSCRPEVIIIAAGTNDMWFANKRPEALSQTVAQVWTKSDKEVMAMKPQDVRSLAMAVRYNVLLLKRTYPKASIVLLTPMQTTEVSDATIAQAGNIIEQCGNRLGCCVLRLDKDSKVVSAQERVQKLYTSDGTHTSRLGAKANGLYVASKLRTILNKNKRLNN